MAVHTTTVSQSILDAVAQHTGASSVALGDVIQALWSGYGVILRLHLSDSAFDTAILKLIKPPMQSAHPRGWDTDVSHQRKLRSYQVESHWYQHYAAYSRPDFKMPCLISANNNKDTQWILMEDLSSQYPRRADNLTIEEAAVCLRWLANFHAFFLNRVPTGLWPTGTYWHLNTRPDELKAMPESRLKGAANLLDKTLGRCEFQTIVHGDAKVANFCFSTDMSAVAAVDFQYVGGGVGIKDVAYFLGSCLAEKTIEQHESQLLAVYFDALEEAITAAHSKQLARQVRLEWSELYSIAWTDFYRFLEGWMPGHKKINRYTKQMADRAFRQLGL